MVREELNHIDPAELADILAGQVNETREREIRQHLEKCGVCQAELALAESFHAQATDTPLAPAIAARIEAGLEARLAPDRPRAFGWRVISGQPTWVRAGLLAASLVCVVLGINALRETSLRQGQSGEMRAPQTAAEWDLQLSEAEPGRVNVTWPVVDEAREYEIRFQSTTGQTLWARRVEAPPHEIRFAALPDTVRSERFLFVTVAALMADGTQQTTRPHALPAQP
jgi:hypothetical protein